MPENSPAPVTRMRVPRGRKVGSADTTPPWGRVPARVIPLRSNAVASTRYGPLVSATATGSKADPEASIPIARRNDFIGNSSLLVIVPPQRKGRHRSPRSSQARTIMPLTSGLKAESGVLHRDSGVTAEQESHETNLEQDEDRHEPRFLVSTALRVN